MSKRSLLYIEGRQVNDVIPYLIWSGLGNDTSHSRYYSCRACNLTSLLALVLRPLYGRNYKERQDYMTNVEDIHVFTEELKSWYVTISDLLDSCNQNGSDYQQYGDILSKSASEIYYQLNSHQKFRDLLKTAKNCHPSESQPWISYDILSTPVMWAGLTTFYGFNPITLHDHPGSYGVQRIVSGKARIKLYQHTSDSDPQQSLVSLEKVVDREFVKDESAYFTRFSCNLHELVSLTPRCILLSIMVHPYKPHDRSWYFPVALSSAGSERLYNRVRKRISPHERME